MARKGHQRMAELLCRSGYFQSPESVCSGGQTPAPAHLAQALAERPHGLANHRPSSRPTLAKAHHPAPVARPATCCHDPRQEPRALTRLAGICAGGAGQPAFLPRSARGRRRSARDAHPGQALEGAETEAGERMRPAKAPHGMAPNTERVAVEDEGSIRRSYRGHSPLIDIPASAAPPQSPSLSNPLPIPLSPFRGRCVEGPGETRETRTRATGATVPTAGHGSRKP